MNRFAFVAFGQLLANCGRTPFDFLPESATVCWKHWQQTKSALPAAQRPLEETFQIHAHIKNNCLLTLPEMHSALLEIFQSEAPTKEELAESVLVQLGPTRNAGTGNLSPRSQLAYDHFDYVVRPSYACMGRLFYFRAEQHQQEFATEVHSYATVTYHNYNKKLLSAAAEL